MHKNQGMSLYLSKELRANHDSFPCVLPFSQMYPLCCIDIRNFLNQIYLFSDDYFQNSSIIDETLKNVSVALILSRHNSSNIFSHSTICFATRFARVL